MFREEDSREVFSHATVSAHYNVDVTGKTAGEAPFGELWPK